MAIPRQNILLGEDFQTMASSFSQIRHGWGITQLIGQDPNRNQPIRSADTWTVTGSTGLTGFNTATHNTDDTDATAAYTMPASDPAVGLCALESNKDAPVDEFRDLSLSALRTATVMSNSGSAVITMHDPMVMSTTGALEARAYVDGEVINQHDLDSLRDQLGITTDSADTTPALPADPLAALGLSTPTTSALVPGLAELDCLNTDQARTWHDRDNSIGTGKPAILAVINAELADDYTLQILKNSTATPTDSSDTAERFVAQLPAETAFVLIDPDIGAVTDLFFINSINQDLPAPTTQINSVAVDQRDPNIIYATFANDDRVYQLMLG